ncbi:MAG: methionyl-tRNA formyltransferase [Erysipelotrichales bacterium]
MNDKKILYMGTTIFSAYILEKLLEAGYNVIGLISQPDRKVGRKKEIKYTATKEVALKYDIEAYGFNNINEHFDLIKELNPDLILTCAFGQKLGKEILEFPPLKCINVHASLLPKYRGGAPIHYAVMSGDKKSGNTIMYMEESLDTGDMLAVSEVPILVDDTTSDLSDKLMVNGAQLVLDIIDDILEDNLSATKQDHENATYSPNISREQEYIDFNRDIDVVYNHIRGLLSIPGCFSYINDKSIKFHKVRKENVEHNQEPGYIEVDNKEYFKIYAQKGYIKVYNFQLEGKKAVNFKDYINGNKLEIETGLVLNKKEL